jgi:hypothetical protein
MSDDIDKYLEAEKLFVRKNSDSRSKMAIVKLVKSGNYISPEREDELIGYMRNNKEVTYTNLINLFGVNLGFLQRLRTRYKFPTIKKDDVKSFQKLLALQNKRRCPACGEVKDLSLWYPNNPSKCKDCDKLNHKSKYEKIVSKHLSSVENFLKYKLTNCSQKKNIDTTITLDDLMKQYHHQNGKCFYSGRPLAIELRTKSLNSLSIDRINSSKGYTPDNIVLCCSIVNIMKLDTPEDEFIRLCRDIVNHQHLLEGPTDYSI